MKTICNFAKQPLLALIVVLTVAPAVLAQPHVAVDLRTGQVRCFEDTILLKHVAEIRSGDARLQRKMESLDLDSFVDHKQTGDVQKPIVLTKAQVRFRLRLAGLSEEQITISGPEQLTVVAAEAASLREIVEQRLQQQLAQQYLMSTDDLKVTLNPRFSQLEKPALDFSTLQLPSTFDTDMPLGNQQVTALVQDESGQFVSQKIPVSIALIRDLVVAKQNISKGETLSADNVDSVRRPVVSRNVRFASFEQAVGKQTQNDVQQYELIKSSAIRTGQTRTTYAIKKNAQVSVIVRRGALTVVLKDAKAMDNGNPGDQIGLINPRTKERIIAKVIDASTAEVRF
jgi:flagella basal body P-ring formation protein FlgA